MEAGCGRRVAANAPEELQKLQSLKVKIEAICEAGDLKRITDLLKDLAEH